MIRELENSLRRLKTEYVDIYYLHQPDDDTPIEVTWRALESQVNAGKIRYIGLSNFAAWQIVDALYLSRSRGWTPPTVTQALYNAISRAADTELLPMTRAFDLGTCLYNPLAGGLLTGKYQIGQEPTSGTRFANDANYRQRYWDERQQRAADAFSQIARDGGRSTVELALRYMLDHDSVDVTLFGATRPEQITANLAALEAAPLDDDERAACDTVWQALHGPVPRYNRTNARPGT